jgi:acetyl esterase/lipase
MARTPSVELGMRARAAAAAAHPDLENCQHVSEIHEERALVDAQHPPSRAAQDFRSNLARYLSGTLVAKQRRRDRVPLSAMVRGIVRGSTVFPADGPRPSPIRIQIHGGSWQELNKARRGHPSRSAFQAHLQG